MKKINKNYIFFIVLIAVFTTGFILKANEDAKAKVKSIDVCKEAAELGVCLGEGAKCEVVVNIFVSPECGKDPEGGSIEIPIESNR